MPRETKVTQSNLEQFTPKDTYDPTTPGLEVVAHRTDPYIDPGRGDAATIAALQSFVQDVTRTIPVYKELQKERKGENVAQARMDQMQGVYNKPSGFFNMGVGYDEAWHALDGEARMGKVHDEYIRALTENNNFVDGERSDEEARKMRDDLFQQTYQKYFQGVQSPYAFGAASELYHATQRKGLAISETAIAEKNLNVLKTNQGQQIDTVLQGGLDDGNLTGVDLKKKADEMWKYQIQPYFGNLITRDQYTHMWLERIQGKVSELANGTMSVTEAYNKGKKLLDMTKAVTDGKSWSDITTDKGEYKFQHAIQQIEHNFIVQLNQREDRDDKRQKKVQDTNKSKFVTELFNLSLDQKLSLNEFTKAATDLGHKAAAAREAGQLDREGYDSFMEHIKMALKGDIIEDLETKNRVLMLSESGRISPDAVSSFLKNKKINVQTAAQAYNNIEGHNRWAASFSQQDRAIKQQEYHLGWAMLKEATDTLPAMLTDINTKEQHGMKMFRIMHEYDKMVKEEKISPTIAASKLTEKYVPKETRENYKTYGQFEFKSMDDLINRYEQGLVPEWKFNQSMAEFQAGQVRAKKEAEAKQKAEARKNKGKPKVDGLNQNTNKGYNNNE